MRFKTEKTALAKALAQLRAVGVWTGVRRCKDDGNRWELLYEVPFEQRKRFLDPNLSADDLRRRDGEGASDADEDDTCEHDEQVEDGWDFSELSYDDSFAY